MKVDRLTHCGDIAIRNFPNERSVVGRTYTLARYTFIVKTKKWLQENSYECAANTTLALALFGTLVILSTAS